MTRKVSPLLLVVAAAMLVGALLRLEHLADRTISHIEMYVPNIPLGTGLSVPKTHTDLWSVVTSTLSADTHPPLYYVLMWFVTKCFGTGTLAMRLPSVVFGVASIGLVFWLGALIGEQIPGCVAAGFVALNGYIIAWDKTARMYTTACFLGLLSTILLVLLARSNSRRRILEAGYSAVTLVGLGTDLFLWALLAVQMVWVLGNAWDQKRSLPRLLKLQILIVILASPLLAFAAYQSINQVIFASKVPAVAREYIQFMYLIPGWDDTWDPAGAPTLTLAPQFFLPRMMLFVFCLLVLVLGIRRLRPIGERMLSDADGSFTTAWRGAALLGVIAILAHVFIATHHPDVKPTLKYTEALTVLPILLLGAAAVLRKSWERLRNGCSRWNLRVVQGSPPLVWMLALGPFAVLVIASLAYRPMTDPRRLLFMSPYLLLVLAAGVVQLAQRSRWVALLLLLILGGLHGFSVWAYSDRTVTPVNFKAFSDKLIPQLQAADLIFLRRAWDTTPVLYYVKPDRYHVFASGFDEACRRHPNARVWALLFRGENLPADMQSALEHYREIESIEVYWARAVLYCPSACESTGQGVPIAAKNK